MCRTPALCQPPCAATVPNLLIDAVFSSRTKTRMQNRIKELREIKGWSMRDLAARVNTSASTINKLEKGETKLTVLWMERLGDVFGVPVEQILQHSETGAVRDDVEPISLGNDATSGYRLTETQTLYTVKSNVLDQIGLIIGDILVAETSPDDIANIQSGDIAIARFRHNAQIALVLRQFIEPSLLITNSSSQNAPIINMRTQDVGIRAVIISSHSTLRKDRLPR